VLLTKYYAGDQIEKNEMGRECDHLEDLGIDGRILKMVFKK